MKTTIFGVVGAIAAVIQAHVQAGHSLTDWKTYLIPAAIAAIGYFSGDKKEVAK